MIATEQDNLNRQGGVAEPLNLLTHQGYNPTQNDIFTRIATGSNALVVSKNNMPPLPLVTRTCAAFPDSRIVVIVPNNATAIRTVQTLRADGQNCWYLDKEYRFRDEEEAPDHRIKVVLESRLALCSLQLHRADIVVVSNAARFLRNQICGFDAMTLFDQGAGTHFKEDARLVGIINEDNKLAEIETVSSVFGPRKYLLNADGAAYLAPWVSWIARKKEGRALRADYPSFEATNLEHMKALVWGNRSRNKCAINQARRLWREAGSYKFVQERYGAVIPCPVAVVAENAIHKVALTEYQAGNNQQIPVLTFMEISRCEDLPSFLVRADAGTGLIPILPQQQKVWVVDIQDQTCKFLSKRFLQRLNQYKRFWNTDLQPKNKITAINSQPTI
jgi:hypothetical protein